MCFKSCEHSFPKCGSFIELDKGYYDGTIIVVKVAIQIIKSNVVNSNNSCLRITTT
jgi:hypothetical protein